MPAKIRVGVLLDTIRVPAWQFAALESIAASECATISHVFVCNPADPAPAATDSGSRFIRWLYGVINRLEAHKKRPEPDACAEVSAEPLMGGANVSDDPMDVLFLLGDPAKATAGLPRAPLGHWYFTCSGRPFAPSNGTLVGLAEYVRRLDTLDTNLEVREPAGGRRSTAYSTRSAIDYSSHYATRNEHLWKCSAIILRALKACHAAGRQDYLPTLPASTERGRDAARSLILLPALIIFLFWRVWKKAYRRLFSERWILMSAIDENIVGKGPFTALIPPVDRFWADPHIVEQDGRHHVFFEDASRESGIGHISVMSDDGQGRFGSPQCILRRPYHLSYPFVFRWDGSWYLIPESGQNRTVELYRSIRFPDVWEPAHTLIEDIDAYDATLVEHAGRWWLFANVRARPGSSTWDELHVFHADNPVSREWRPHRFNPVVSDVCRARPAGRFYSDGGRLYRPSQNSSRRYGRALMINEVIELSESCYRERTVCTIGPREHRRVKAIHSYSRAGRLTFIDAIRRESRLARRQDQSREVAVR